MIERKAADSSAQIVDVIVLNADFRWQGGEVSILEIADGINNSGYTGYNRLYGKHPKDEVMFKEIFNKLARHFQRIYVIHHTTKETTQQIPVHQLGGKVKSFDTYFEFVDYIRDKKINPANSLVVVGEDLGVMPFAFAPRTVTEVRAFLKQQGIKISVANGAEMFKFVGNKIIFNMVCPYGVTNFFIVNSDTLLQKIDLFLLESTSAYVVLKPPAECRGKDVTVLSRDNLIEMQAQLHSNKDKSKQPEIFSHLLATYGNFILQDYIESTEIIVQGLPYDPTGRAVLILYKTEGGSYEVELVDAYWKLPKKSKKDGIDQASQISYINEDSQACSAKLAEADKAKKLLDAFKGFFRSPAKMFLTGIDFLIEHYPHLQEDEQRYLLDYLEKNGIDITIPTAVFDKIQWMEKCFSFYFYKILIKSLAMMLQNDFLEMPKRKDFVLFENEICSLLKYLTSESSLNKLILPSGLLADELIIISDFSVLYPDINALMKKIEKSQRAVEELVEKYQLANNSAGELGKGLRRAAFSGDVNGLTLFLEMVKNIDEQDSHPAKRCTALHYAVKKGAYGCVKLLLGRGCQVTLKNASGKTVLELIEESGDQILKDLLAQSQAVIATQLAKRDQCAARERKVLDTKQVNTSSPASSLPKAMPLISPSLTVESTSPINFSPKEQKCTPFSRQSKSAERIDNAIAPGFAVLTDKVLNSTSRTKRQCHEQLLRLGIFKGNDEGRKESYRHVSSGESRVTYRTVIKSVLRI